MHNPMNAGDQSDPFFRPWENYIELQRVDGTGDVERFDDPVPMRSRYDDIVANEPEIVFVAAIADRRPVTAFRRDTHPTLLSLSEARQKRAQYLCVGAQARHRRRYGPGAIEAMAS